jgi:predicted transcriptional regulator
MELKDSLSVIKKYWDSAPVDVFAIARDLGVEVNRVPLAPNISGLIRRKDHDGFAIDVNNTHSLVRQRFTVAHELGHYIYHRDLLGEGVGDTLAYRAEGTALENSRIKQEHERQANTFAANLLMPKALIEKLEKQGIRELPDLARALQVSEDALRIRLGRATNSRFEPEPNENEVEVIRTGGR